MRAIRTIACLPILLISAVGAQTPAPVAPTADETRDIQNRLTELSQRVGALAATHVDAALVADVDVYRKAAEYILRFPEEFANRTYISNTIVVLEKGLARARELEAGAPSWPKQKGHVVRAYVSRLDGSVQPYGLTIPDSYDGSRPIRLDIWQHGTDRTLNEVAFILKQERSGPVSPVQDYIQLEPLGRTNVSYRWAGEADLFEALASVQQRYNIDARRIVLRGFSMGGASSWHLGLHHPGRWAAIEAGAGYTETQRYGKKDNLPSHQRAMLHYYDAVDYSLNAFNTPTVGYGGEIDAQLQASVNIREQLTKEGFRFQQDGPFRWMTTDLRALFLVGPNTGHSWHADSKAESNAYINKVLEQADRVPDHVRFVTYTTRFNRAHWLTVDGLDETYARAEVDAKRSAGGAEYTLTTKNVAALSVEGPGGAFTIDGQRLGTGAKSFEKANGKWRAGGPVAAGELRKVHGLQGPVDDAFMDAFLCVRPTGAAWNPVAADWGSRTLDVFKKDFAKWLRGDVRLKDDRAVSASDIASYNLILFGDPGSNSVIASVVDRLPIRWSKTSIAIGAQTFSASDHVPVLIYPNPLNPKRYVVINSGHTFGEVDFRATNAWLFPRIGDYAVLNASGNAAMSGFFDEHWRLPRAARPSAVEPAQVPATGKPLDIYFIDTEGGQATLYVSPSGQTLLVDSGNAGERDLGRILEVLNLAGVKQIDHFFLTHYHGDHYGSLPELSKRIPIKHFYDHGDSVELDRPNIAAFAKIYADIVRTGQHTVVKPGDTIALPGTEITVVTSGGNVLQTPIARAPGAGRPNAACASFRERDESRVDPDNHQSAGFVLAYGRFRMANLGDFTWNREFKLMCPNNPIGTVDLYLTSHHGLDQSGSGALVHGLQPRVAIMNNGTRKGGHVQTAEILESSPGLEDRWQLHWSYWDGVEHNAPGVMIANVDEPAQLAAILTAPAPGAPPAAAPPPAGPGGNANHSPAHYLKVSAQTDGSFQVTNSRNKYTKTYSARNP